MIHIKTQNIPLESFSTSQEKKTVSDISGEEFSMAFDTSYNEYSEVTEENTKDSTKETATAENMENVDDIENNYVIRHGLFWLIESQLSLENLESTEFSIDNSSIQIPQLNQLNENIKSMVEMETMERIDVEPDFEEITGKIPEYFSVEDTHKEISDAIFTILENHEIEEIIEDSTPASSQNSEITNNKATKENPSTELVEVNETKDIDQLFPTVKNEIISGEIEGAPFELITSETETISKESVSPVDSKAQIESLQSFNKSSETESTIVPKIEEKEIQEQSTREVIGESEFELLVDETLKPAFDRGIEQLQNLRMIEPKSQGQEIIKVPETEWVTQIESIITENIHTVSDPEMVSTTRIQLTPEHLGKMDIELVLKDKGLTAKLVVEYVETKEWLEQKVAELTVKLATQSIEIADFQVSIAENNQSFVNAGTQDNPFFKEKNESDNQRKSLNYSSEKEQVVETIDNKSDLGNGRLSMWV